MSRLISFIKSELLDFWNIWTAYNPERYYMRGPGPKWREKHAGEPAMRIDGANRVVSAR
jgi:hypothetical protein